MFILAWIALAGKLSSPAAFPSYRNLMASQISSLCNAGEESEINGHEGWQHGRETEDLEEVWKDGACQWRGLCWGNTHTVNSCAPRNIIGRLVTWEEIMEKRTRSLQGVPVWETSGEREILFWPVCSRIFPAGGKNGSGQHHGTFKTDYLGVHSI